MCTYFRLLWQHYPKGNKSWFSNFVYEVLDWPVKFALPEPHGEYLAYFQDQDERHQTQQYIRPDGCCQNNLGNLLHLRKTSCSSPPCHSTIEAINLYKKSVQTMYWIDRNEDTLQKLGIFHQNITFTFHCIVIFWDTDFGAFITVLLLLSRQFQWMTKLCH